MESHALWPTNEAEFTSPGLLIQDEHTDHYHHETFCFPCATYHPDPDPSVSFTKHTQLECERSTPAFMTGEPSVDFLEMSTSSLSNTNPAFGGTPWSYYEPSTPWLDRTLSGSEHATDYALCGMDPSNQSLVDTENKTVSDDVWSVQADCYSNHIFDDSWGTSTYTSAIQDPNLAHSFFSMPSPSVSSYLNDFDFELRHAVGTRHWHDSPESFLDVSHHKPPNTHDAEPSLSQSCKEPPYICPEDHCLRLFQRQPDLSRHQRTKHINYQGSQRYSCALKECPKTGKVWARLDSFKQHVAKWHKGADMDGLVKRSSRTLHVGDAMFSIATPESMLHKRRVRADQRLRKQ